MSGIEKDEDFRFLHGLLKDRRLHLLLKVHERLKLFGRSSAPVQDNAQDLLCDLLKELQVSGVNEDATELISVLMKPHVKALMSVLDSVSQKNYDPQLPPLPGHMEEEDSVKIVSLVKSQEPLGATIKRDEGTGAIVVARIMRGGAADKSGLIHEGDELREVNGVPLADMEPEEIVPILALSQGAVTFKMIPGNQVGLSANENQVFVRCLFDYEPQGDPAIPCREAGLGFRKGDVLEILSQRDDTWWQARSHADGDTLAGLIPSRQLQERRLALQRPQALFQPHRVHTHPEEDQAEEDTDYGAITGIHIAGLRKSFRLSRRSNHGQPATSGNELDSTTQNQTQTQTQIQTQTQDQNQDQDQDQDRTRFQAQAQAHTYLEVVPYLRSPQDPHRLVVLVGPSGVGVSELKRRLLISDPDLYAATVPHTTRERRRQEREGVDYFFVSRQVFEEAILDHKFLEYGRYRGDYYGIILASVHRILAEGKVCLLDVQPQTIQRLSGAALKPLVVFVKPPSLEELRLTRRRSKLLSDQQDHSTHTRRYTEEDFEDMIGSAVAMETQYGHLFEKAVVNGDAAVALNELRAALGRRATEVQWVPAAWLPS